MLQMAGAIAREMLNAFFMNYFFIFLYILVILFIRSQYQKYSDMQSDIYGKPVKSLKERTEHIILTGLVAGFAASFIAVASGITIETESVRYLFYIMCLLLLFDMRFLNISYAAGILAGFSLIFGYPEVNIPSLLALVSILQMVQSLLIYFNRKSDLVPIFINHNDEITGAFLIRRFWMIPIVFFTYVLQNAGVSSNFSANWTMLFGSGPLKDGIYALGLDCLVAVLCYSDIAITKHPEKKCTQSAALLFTYSAILLLISVFALRISWLDYIGVIFCVLAHEGIHFYSIFTEKRGQPLYNAVRRGLRVMDVLPQSHAQLMGMQRGDIILSINNNDIQTDEGAAEALREFPTFTWIRVSGWDGKERTIEYRCFPGGYNSLGIITVPREKEVTYNTGSFEHMSILKNIVNKFRGIDRSV
ncbi:MAG: PDZ domain-containing protein [Clostridiaceae bacterium]